MHLTTGDCAACYKFLGRPTFLMKRSADVLTSHHTIHTTHLKYCTLATLHMLIHLWTTVELSGPSPRHLSVCQDTGTILHLAMDVCLTLHCSVLVWQLPVVKHRINIRRNGTIHHWMMMMMVMSLSSFKSFKTLLDNRTERAPIIPKFWTTWRPCPIRSNSETRPIK